MITIRNELSKDVAAREALLDLSFGDARYAKPSERLREGRRPADGLSFVACDRAGIIGPVLLWHVSAGAGHPAVLLGPLAVHPDFRNRGIGSALMGRALDDARALGHGAVLLVGDQPYYGRFGFSTERTGGLWLPGRYDPQRFLALELKPGALDGAHGLVTGTGRPLQRRPLSTRIAGSRPQQRLPRAA